jgi:hypothetical protein
MRMLSVALAALALGAQAQTLRPPLERSGTSDAASDRYIGVAHSGAASARMVLDLLSVDDDAVAVQVTFSGGIVGRALLRGLVRHGTVHLNGVMDGSDARYDIALRATPREDGGLSGVYETSQQPTRARRTGSFWLTAVDSAAIHAAAGANR